MKDCVIKYMEDNDTASCQRYLLVDGHNITIIKTPSSPTVMRYCIFIDGMVRGVWANLDSKTGSKFWCPVYCGVPENHKNLIIKALELNYKGEELRENMKELVKTKIVGYKPCFDSVASILIMLRKCESVEIL